MDHLCLFCHSVFNWKGDSFQEMRTQTIANIEDEIYPNSSSTRDGNFSEESVWAKDPVALSKMLEHLKQQSLESSRDMPSEDLGFPFDIKLGLEIPWRQRNDGQYKVEFGIREADEIHTTSDSCQLCHLIWRLFHYQAHSQRPWSTTRSRSPHPQGSSINMSGLEIVAAIAGIVSAFNGSITLYRSWRDKRRERRNAQNQNLERSLSLGGTTVQQEYNVYIARLGQRFAIGDAQARAELSQYVIRLQHIIITLMTESGTEGVVVLPGLPGMLSDSEGTRTGAVRTMAEQYQRMMQARPLYSSILFSSRSRSDRTPASWNLSSSRGRFVLNATRDNMVPMTSASADRQPPISQFPSHPISRSPSPPTSRSPKSLTSRSPNPPSSRPASPATLQPPNPPSRSPNLLLSRPLNPSTLQPPNPLISQSPNLISHTSGLQGACRGKTRREQTMNGEHLCCSQCAFRVPSSGFLPIVNMKDENRVGIPEEGLWPWHQEVRFVGCYACPLCWYLDGEHLRFRVSDELMNHIQVDHILSDFESHGLSHLYLTCTCKGAWSGIWTAEDEHWYLCPARSYWTEQS
ncbi:hypothetical protein BKA65DRAFT_477243 [Rhexocercosporidium sp. MPI-PUGE-AT-0058]|nr:hypothetical protein BKA65DRAFT_477243 [Rhexocercosporidium sp. MPI-PUGE-AT-0058]